MTNHGDRHDRDTSVDADTPTEQRVLEDPDWQRGMQWGRPRPGHPEGQVILHVRDVLANFDRYAPSDDPATRSRLRLIALLHDACKVDAGPGGPHHGVLARRLAERFTDDEAVLDVIELHDDAYRCWRLVDRGRAGEAQERADALVARIEHCLDLYLLFYRCDSMTAGKDRDPFDWFETFVGA